MSISCIVEYIEFVQKSYSIWPDNPKELFFRGQSSKGWPILPSVFRSGQRSVNERSLILDFKQVAVYDMDYRPKIENILVKMQHYGIPTRMLDWSLSPLIALYFACQSTAGRDDGEVFVLNPWEAYQKIVARISPHAELMDILKESRMLLAQKWDYDTIRKYVEKKYNYVVEPEALRAPIPFVGRYMVDRVATQRSGFVLWGDGDAHIYAPSVYTSLEQYHEYTDSLGITFEIPYAKKNELLTWLRQLGIDSFTIFPDNYGMSREIKEVGSLFNY